MNSKWIAVVGSSRHGNNTELLVDYMLDALRDIDKEVQKVILDSEAIRTCDGCETCLETGKCHIDDETRVILAEIETAEGIIFASPTYNYAMSAQMKALLDRTFYLGVERRKHPSALKQKAIVLGVCRGMTKESMGHTVSGMSTILEELDMDIIDVIEYYNTKAYPVAKNQMIKEIIQQRVIDLVHKQGGDYGYRERESLF